MSNTAKKDIKLSAEAEKRVDELKNKYPSTKSAVMPLLYIAQEELGWLTEEAYLWVSDRLDLPPAHVREVATFYTMYYKKPVANYPVFPVHRPQLIRVAYAAPLTKEAARLRTSPDQD